MEFNEERGGGVRFRKKDRLNTKKEGGEGPFSISSERGGGKWV